MELIVIAVIYFIVRYAFRFLISKNEVKCPYCFSEYDLAEGVWGCSKCRKTFRKVKDRVYRMEDVAPPLVDELGKLLSQIAKADGVVSKAEKDYIISVLVDNFNLNEKQKQWILNVCNEAKDKEYSTSTVLGLRKEVKTFKKSKEISLDILHLSMVITYLDDSPSKKQNEIIKDIINEFNISLSEYEKVKVDILGSEDEHKTQDYVEECFKILGIPIGSSEEEIKKAYKRLVKVYHPDKYTSSELHENIRSDIQEKMIDINNAYEFLIHQNKTV